MSFTNLVIGGGGYNGLAYLGLLFELDRKGILSNIINFAGSSVGALICIGLSITSPSNIIDILLGNTDKLLSMDDANYIDLIEQYGIFPPDKILNILQQLIQNKYNLDDLSFGELHDLTKKTVFVCATNLNSHSPEYFSHHTHAQLSISKAIAMSTCIPFIFYKQVYNNNIYADGGMTDNFPFTVFDDNNTLGIKTSRKDCDDSNINSIVDYAYSCVSVLLYSRQSSCVDDITTIYVPSNCNLVEFDLKPEFISSEINRGKQIEIPSFSN
jgi:predicted acylesterase/phospholipase RssA